MPETLVSVERLSKKYCRGLRQGMAYAAADTTRDLLGLSSGRDRLRGGEFWAVDDVSFTLARGECLGLVGANGAGKSTLLKLLNGIVRPDRGRIRIRGRVGALIEVGAGFHPLLSGRENVYVNGAILGMGRREIDRKLDSILAFSGLSPDLLDAPVRSYSSGMYVRLGFAVAAHSEPDVLLVDEILSVGDLQFVGRCRRHIQQLLDGGAAVIFVSHRLNEVEGMCQGGLLLRQGRVAARGTARAVVEQYRREAPAGDPAFSSWRAAAVAAPDGPRLRRVELTDEHGREAGLLRVGERCSLRVETAGEGSADELLIWLLREEGETVTAGAAVPWHALEGDPGQRRLAVEFPMPAVPGTYRLGVRISAAGSFEYLDEVLTAPFQVTPDRERSPYVPRRPFGYFVLDLQPAAVVPAPPPAGAASR